MAKLRVDKKAHHRKGHLRKGKHGRKHYVKPASVKRAVFLTKDRGHRGRSEPQE